MQASLRTMGSTTPHQHPPSLVSQSTIPQPPIAVSQVVPPAVGPIAASQVAAPVPMMAVPPTSVGFTGGVMVQAASVKAPAAASADGTATQLPVIAATSPIPAGASALLGLGGSAIPRTVPSMISASTAATSSSAAKNAATAAVAAAAAAHAAAVGPTAATVVPALASVAQSAKTIGHMQPHAMAALAGALNPTPAKPAIAVAVSSSSVGPGPSATPAHPVLAPPAKQLEPVTAAPATAQAATVAATAVVAPPVPPLPPVPPAPPQA